VNRIEGAGELTERDCWKALCARPACLRVGVALLALFAIAAGVSTVDVVSGGSRKGSFGVFVCAHAAFAELWIHSSRKRRPGYQLFG
jgi:hypothetical protein